jgi:VanZ family protein
MSARALHRARLGLIAWVLFMLALTSWPSPPEIPGVSSIPNVDKLIHGFLYGVGGLLLYRAIAWPDGGRGSWLRPLLIAGIAAVWGTLDEAHQAWIPGRSMEAADALGDTVGAFLGALVAWAARRPDGPTSLRPSGTFRPEGSPAPGPSPTAR